MHTLTKCESFLTVLFLFAAVASVIAGIKLLHCLGFSGSAVFQREIARLNKVLDG